jgi:hypothetical protein
MGIYIPQNPGIGGLDEITDLEALTIQNISGLGDPNADRILFWDESANSYQFLTAGTNLTISGTTINATGGSGSGITRVQTSISTPQTAGSTALTDYTYYITGTTTLTLPTAVGNANRYELKSVSGITTIATTSSQTIDGTTTIVISPEDSVTVESDGTNWRII